MTCIRTAAELTDAVIQDEIRALLGRAHAEVASRKAQLVLGADFAAREDQLVDGPIGRKMRAIFDFVRNPAVTERSAVAQQCGEVLEFLWTSAFAGHYQIPDSFWDTPLGFAIYEVIGRTDALSADSELTLPQASKYLGIAQAELEDATRDGHITPTRTVGSHPRYRVGDLPERPSRLRES